MVEKIWFTLETANKIVGYLGTRPYQEVYQLLQEIQKAVDVQQAEKKAMSEPMDPSDSSFT